MTTGEPPMPSGWTLLAYDVVDSTNAEAARLSAAGALERTAVWARRQSAGRGRQGRVWESPEGNLHVSFLLLRFCGLYNFTNSAKSAVVICFFFSV